MNMAMTLLSACADNNLGTDTEREVIKLICHFTAKVRI